jgi:hypothetical protein
LAGFFICYTDFVGKFIIYFQKSKKALILFFILAVFLRAEIVQAQSIFTQYLEQINAPGGAFDVGWLYNLISNFACYFIRFAIIVFGVMLVIYGIMFFQSRGAAGGMVSAKKALTWGLVGGLVVFSVFTIVLSIATIINANYDILGYVSCS